MDLLKSIRSYAELEQNWDSYGAKPIAPAAIKTALALVRALPPGAWTVMPTNRGGVSFEEESGLTISIEP